MPGSKGCPLDLPNTLLGGRSRGKKNAHVPSGGRSGMSAAAFPSLPEASAPSDDGSSGTRPSFATRYALKPSRPSRPAGSEFVAR